MFRSLAPGAIGVRADLPRAAELAGKYGFAGVHVGIDEIVKLGVAPTQEILARRGVCAAAVGLPVDCTPPEARFADALARLPGLCQVAQEMGITRTSTWIPSWHDSLDFSENYALLRDRIRRVAAILRDYGIRFGLEFLGPKTLRDGKKHAFIHTMDGMLELCRDVGTGNVGLLLDAFHWYTAHGTLADIARLTDADVVDVHVNDAQPGLGPDEQIDQIRALPGETGVIDLTGFLQGLAQIGYTGPVMVEPFSKRVNALPAEEAVRVTAEALDKVWKAAGLIGAVGARGGHV